MRDSFAYLLVSFLFFLSRLVKRIPSYSSIIESRVRVTRISYRKFRRGFDLASVKRCCFLVTRRFILDERVGRKSRRSNVRARTNRYLIVRRSRTHVHVHVRAARARNTCHVLATASEHTRGIPIRTREHTLDPRAG